MSNGDEPRLPGGDPDPPSRQAFDDTRQAFDDIRRAILARAPSELANFEAMGRAFKELVPQLKPVTSPRIWFTTPSLNLDSFRAAVQRELKTIRDSRARVVDGDAFPRVSFVEWSPTHGDDPTWNDPDIWGRVRDAVNRADQRRLEDAMWRVWVQAGWTLQNGQETRDGS